MDTAQLIKDAKARFKHRENKLYLQEKYGNKLIFADQGGMWKADQTLIGFLHAIKSSNITETVISDNFHNPIPVNVAKLLNVAIAAYTLSMNEWHVEYLSTKDNR